MCAPALMASSILIIVAASQATVPDDRAQRDNAVVTYQPMHPLADVAGFVLHTRGDMPLQDPPPEGAGGAPPDMPGWPVTIAHWRPVEGPAFVDADDDPELEILFATLLTVHLLNLDGTSLPGWPITVPTGTRTTGGPAFGDLDGDGECEVIVCADDWPNGDAAWVYAYHTDGALLTGFPAKSFGDNERSPTVVDLDGDGAAEIIIGERQWPNGKVYVYGGDGLTLPGWPVDLDHVPASSAGAADLDGDGVKEIIFESFASLYAFHMDGSIVDGFPFTPPTGDTFSFSAPVFADVDGDGLPEIAVGGHHSIDFSSMFLIDGDGSQLPGWPRVVAWWIFAPATFADLDADGDLEIIVGDQVASARPSNRVHAWHHDGSPVAGFPVGPIQAINAQIVVADIDGDTDPELIWDDNTTSGEGTGFLLAYHHTGVAVADWPVVTQGTTFFNTAAVADCDGDGDLELLAAAGRVDTPVTTMYLWDLEARADPANIQMPMFQYGPERNGLPPATPPACTWDLDGDNTVGTSDLIALLGSWGDPYDTADLIELLGNWGPCS